jgi:methyl-accepting chemotaxis protein
MFRRKNYFIKKKFQIHFLYKFILLLVVESVLIGGLFAVLSRNTLTTGYLDSGLRVASTGDFFFAPFAVASLGVALVIGIAGMIVFILLSHRIAGPLYRFEKILENLNDGDLTTTVHLRGTDQLVDFEKKLNAFIHTLRTRLSLLQSKEKELRAALNGGKDPELVLQLKEKLDDLKDEIDYFKIPKDLENHQ